MPIEVELPNGVIAEFPDGMSNADIESVLAKQFGGQADNGSSPVAANTPFSEQVNTGDIPVMDDQGNLMATPADPVKEESSLFDKGVAGLETVGALASGATLGMAGQALGSIEGIIKEVAAGNFGTKEAADRIEQLAMKRSGQGTRAPKTELGQEVVEGIGQALDPLNAVAPLSMNIQGALVGARAPKINIKSSSLMAERGKKTLSDKSVGAAQTGKELERATTAESLGFTGDSALTKGQVTRNFELLQFEKEAAKIGETGLPLRNRIESQTQTIMSNLDALADQPSPLRTELRDIGRSVDSALVARAESLKNRVDAQYERARRAGEMREPVNLSSLPDALADMSRFDGVAPNSKSIRAEALRVGAVVDNDGLKAGVMTLDDIENFRGFVNEVTDLSSPQQSRIRRIALSAIDDATENAGGDLYRKARRSYSAMANELENTGITKRLLATKKGTTERSVAYEDVFKKIILDSPIEEINKLRGTILKSGDQGKQVWADIKAKGIEYIKENAQSASQSDAKGNPLLSVDKLNKTISVLDSQGKLDKIYGAKNAQVLRDLADLSKDMFTAPPGAINFSNTSSALAVALDSLGTFAVTGVPAPVATTLKASLKYVKDAKTKSRIRESLNYLQNSSKNN